MSSTYRTLLIILIGAGILAGCHDQLLHPEPESVLTTSNFYTSASDIDRAVLGTYERLQSRATRDFVVMGAPTDNMYGEYYAVTQGMDQLENLDVTPDNNEINRFWQNTYNGIFRANSVLQNIDVPDDYAEGERDQYEGEAKFLRAYFYFDMVRLFGGVPRVTTQQSVEEAREEPRASEQEIYDLIIEDLTDAVNRLPEPSQAVHGRASRAAAEALLGKVYVYLEDYGQARPHLESVLNNYHFELLTDYSDLWNMDTQINNEAIFSLAFLDGSSEHWLSQVFNPNEGLLGYTTRGSRIVRPTWDLHRQFEDGDARFEQTIMEEVIPWAGSPDDEPRWFPIFTKFLVPDLGSQDSSLDIPLLRLADVILLYSEVLYELEGPEAALPELNRVRERAFGDDAQNYALGDISSREDFVDTLLHERRLEFVLENERWFDIVRMGKLTEILGGELESEYNPSTGSAEIQHIDAQPYMRYFPIPEEQINISSPGVLQQNDGY